MKTFAEFLTEGRDAPLFHGTTLSRAETILQTETIRRPVSLTRDMLLARNFVLNVYSPLDWVIVFQLDQAKLAHNYKLTPHNYFYHMNPFEPSREEETVGQFANGRNEYEELIDKPITDIEKYLVKIHLFKIRLFDLDAIETYVDNYPIVFKHSKTVIHSGTSVSRVLLHK